MAEEKKMVLISVEELIGILRAEFNTTQTIPAESNKPIKGISGLAEFLGVSTTTAQKIKNNNKGIYKQFGRIVLFDRNEVMRLKNYK